MHSLLIVDDMPAVTDALAQDISWADVGITRVFRAYDITEALRILQGEKVDVLLTDIRMPGGDGLELIARIIGRWKGLKIILYSAYDEFAYAQRAIEYGVSFFLTKPTAYAEILAKVACCIKSLEENTQDSRPARAAGAMEQEGPVHAGSPADYSVLVRRTKEYVGANLHRSISLQEIAGAIHVHPNYLSRVFKKQEGQTIFDYIIARKMDLAITLLKEPGVRVADIPEQLGYESLSYFSRVFKRQTGYSPREYMDRYL